MIVAHLRNHDKGFVSPTVVRPKGITAVEYFSESVVANALLASGLKFDTAYLDKHDGLVLVNANDVFWLPRLCCGNPLRRTRSRTTALILALFGFGELDNLYAQIKAWNCVKLALSRTN